MREMVAGMILLKKDKNIRGHVFLSFLALGLRKELEGPLERYGYCISLNYFFATVQDQSKYMSILIKCDQFYTFLSTSQVSTP